MKLNQVLLCHHWSVYVLFICIASMMLEWVQSWALANQNINIHHYEYITLKHRTTYQAKNYLFYSCFEPLLMLGRQSASVLNFLMLHFFVTTFIYLFIRNVSSVNHSWTKNIIVSKKSTWLLCICENCTYLM